MILSVVLPFFLSTAQAQPVEKTEVVFNVRLAVDPLGFDWNKTSTDWLIASNIMEGLVQYNADLSVRPAIATSWTISPDQKTYTFTLDDKARWSDGAPVTADHFLKAWERVLNPDMGSPYSTLLFDIDGAREYQSSVSKKRDFTKVGIVAQGPHRLEVRLKRPSPYFLSLLTYRALFPIRQELIEKTTNYWAKPSKVAVTGPYLVSSYEPQKTVVLKRNPYYHGKPASIDVINMLIIKDNREAVKRFESGELDFVTKIDFKDVEAIHKKNNVIVAPSFLLHFLAFNTKQYPMSIPLVRQAIAMGFDRSKLNTLFGNSKIATTSLLPSSLGNVAKTPVLAFSPLEARKRLREAGLDTTAGIVIDVLGDINDDNQALMDFLKDELKKNLFMNVDVHLSDYKAYRTALEMGAGAVFSRMWSPDYPAVEAFLRIFTSESGTHKTGWKSLEYDRLIIQSEDAASTANRTLLQESAMQILLQKEVPIVPLFFAKHVYLLSSKFTNLNMRPIGSPYFKEVQERRSP